MAGDWIKIEHALLNKPEVMGMANELGISEFEVVGHLVCFWTWVDQNLSAECPVVSGTMSGLDRVAGLTGFCSAMVDVGWLELTNGEVKIPNYDDHLSQSAKSRTLEAKRKRIKRLESVQMSGSVRDKCPENVREIPVQEKRREEKSKKKTGTGTAGVLSLVSQEILADPKRVLDWFRKASSGKRKVLKPTESNKRASGHRAQRVLRDSKINDPVKVFVANVRDKNFKMTNAEEDAAIEIIKMLERGPPQERDSDLSSKPKTAEGELAKLNAHFGKQKRNQ